MQYRSLAIGVDDLEEIIEKNYYYIDKTGFIKELFVEFFVFYRIFEKGGSTKKGRKTMLLCLFPMMRLHIFMKNIY